MPECTGCVALPASEDPDLLAQFDVRVRRMFALLDAAAADRGVVADLREALHQLAGTAAFFGAPRLGMLAREVDERLGDADRATPKFLAEARIALHRATEGSR